MESGNYGILLNGPDIKLHRKYFDEMCFLIGIKVLFYAPKPSKHWTTYAEIETNFYEPKLISCVFEDHPNQYTMKKLGWDSELQENASLISVPYDLEGIQVGDSFFTPYMLVFIVYLLYIFKYSSAETFQEKSVSIARF